MKDLTSESHSEKGQNKMMIRKSAMPRAGSEGPLSTPFFDATVKDMAKVFKLLSDETRLRVLFYLTREKEFHVRGLCEVLGQSQPAVSHHLALLRMAGLIESRREGKHNFYRLLPERFQRLLDHVFAAVPESDRAIRFEDYVLSYQPQDNLL